MASLKLNNRPLVLTACNVRAETRVQLLTLFTRRTAAHWTDVIAAVPGGEGNAGRFKSGQWRTETVEADARQAAAIRYNGELVQWKGLAAQYGRVLKKRRMR